MEFENLTSRLNYLRTLISQPDHVVQDGLLSQNGLLDCLLMLYRECQNDYLRRNIHAATFLKDHDGVFKSVNEFNISRSDFEFKKVIGRGHFGDVNLVKCKLTGKPYALKSLRKLDILAQSNSALFQSERDIMARTTSPWLTKLQYAFQDELNLYLVMDFHPGGDLLSLLERYDKMFDLDMAKFYLAELITAINSIHNMGYVHRDIKPENCVLDRCGHLHLCDFGSAAKMSKRGIATAPLPIGTPDYLCAELLAELNENHNTTKYGKECDFWSVGVIAYECIFGRHPFLEGTEEDTELFQKIINYKKHLNFPTSATRPVKVLINSLLCDPRERLGYETLIHHSFFQDIDFDNLQHKIPPFIPTLSSEDDASNFDEFDRRASGRVARLSSVTTGFSGQDLPFLGFTFTRLSAETEMRVAKPNDSAMESSYSTASEGTMLSPMVKLTVQCEVPKKQKQENSKLKQKIADLEFNHSSMSDHTKALEAQVDRKDRENGKLKVEKENAEIEVAKLTAQVKTLKNVLESEQNERDRIEKQANKLFDDIQSQYEVANQLRGEEIDGQLESQKEIIAELEDEKTELLGKIRRLEADLRNMRSNYEKGSTRVEQLQTHISTYQKEKRRSVDVFTTDLRQQLSESKESERSLRDENMQLTIDKKALETELEQKIKKCEDMEERNTTLTQEIETVRSQRAPRRSSTGRDSSDLAEKLEMAEARATNLKDMFDSKVDYIEFLRDRITDLKEQRRLSQAFQRESSSPVRSPRRHSPSKSRSVSPRKSVSDVHKSVSEVYASSSKPSRYSPIADSAIDTEVSPVTARSASSDRLKVRVDLYERRLNRANESLQKAQEAEKKAHDMAEKLELENSRLQETMEKLRKENEILKNELTQVSDDFERFESQCETLIANDKANANLKEEFKQLESQVEYNVRVRIKHEEEAVRLRKELEGLKTRESNQQKMVNDLKSACVDMETQLDDMTVINENLERQLAQWNKERKEYEDMIRNLESQVRSTEREVTDAKAERKRVENRCSDLDHQLGDQKSVTKMQLEQYKRDLVETKDKCKHLEAQVADLKKNSSATEVALRNAREELLSEQKMTCSLKEETTSLITQIHGFKATNFKLSEGLQEAMDKYDILQREKEELVDDCERVRDTARFEKFKLESTITQQGKLVDFLQQKIDNPPKKKKLFLTKPPAEPIVAPVNLERADLAVQLDKARTQNVELTETVDTLRDELYRAKTDKVSSKSKVNENRSSPYRTTPGHVSTTYIAPSLPITTSKTTTYLAPAASSSTKLDDPSRGHLTSLFKSSPSQKLFVNCCMRISKDVLLLGTVQGLSALNASTGKLSPIQVGGSVTNIERVPQTELVVLVVGTSRELHACAWNALKIATSQASVGSATLKTNPVLRLSGCLIIKCGMAEKEPQ